MKKLVTSKTIEDFANRKEGKYFLVDESTLISPSARDTANHYGIKIVYEEVKASTLEANEAVNESVCSVACSCDKISEADKELIVEMVIKVLAEKGLLDKILK